MQRDLSSAVKIGDLIAAGRLLEIHCDRCGRFRLAEPGTLSLAAGAAVPALRGALTVERHSRQRCSKPRAGQQTPDEAYFRALQPIPAAA